MTWKRKLIFALVLANIFGLSACTSREPEKETVGSSGISTENSTVETEPEETEYVNVYEEDDLPDDLDFEGRIFNIAYCDEFLRDLNPEQSGEIMDDTVFYRNIAVEDRLKVDLGFVSMASDPNYYVSKITNGIRSGAQAFEAAYLRQWDSVSSVTKGYYMDTTELPYLNLNKPWWADKYMQKMSIDGESAYFLVGDYSASLLQYMSCMYFNKDLYENYMGDPNALYEIVMEGKWTLDEMNNQVAAIYEDKNGNGKKDAKDIVGLNIDSGSATDFLIGSAGNVFSYRDENGLPVVDPMNASTAERLIDTLDKIIYLHNNNPGRNGGFDGLQNICEAFCADKSAFMVGTFSYTDWMRDMEAPYGVIPCPKFDENDEEYLSMVHDAVKMLAVSTDCKDKEMAGAVLEALASEGYRTIAPQYYETVLKIKYARDEVTSQIIDIIHDGVITDFAYVYDDVMSDIVTKCRKIADSGQNTYASWYASVDSAVQKATERLLKSIK